MNDDESGVHKPLVDNFAKFQEYIDQISENIPIVANYVEALKEYKSKMGTQQDTKSMRTRMNNEIGESNELIKQTLDLIQDLEDLKFKNKKDIDNKKKMLRRLNNSFEDLYEEFTKLIKEIHSNEKRFIDLQQSIFNASVLSEQSATFPPESANHVNGGSIYERSSLIENTEAHVQIDANPIIAEENEIHIDDVIEEPNENIHSVQVEDSTHVTGNVEVEPEQQEEEINVDTVERENNEGIPQEPIVTEVKEEVNENETIQVQQDQILEQKIPEEPVEIEKPQQEEILEQQIFEQIVPAADQDAVAEEVHQEEISEQKISEEPVGVQQKEIPEQQIPEEPVEEEKPQQGEILEQQIPEDNMATANQDVVAEEVHQEEIPEQNIPEEPVEVEQQISEENAAIEAQKEEISKSIKEDNVAEEKVILDGEVKQEEVPEEPVEEDKPQVEVQQEEIYKQIVPEVNVVIEVQKEVIPEEKVQIVEIKENIEIPQHQEEQKILEKTASIIKQTGVIKSERQSVISRNGGSIVQHRDNSPEGLKSSIRVNTMQRSVVREDMKTLKESIVDARNNLEFYASIIQERERQMATVKRISSETNLFEGNTERERLVADRAGDVGVVINDVSHSQTIDKPIRGSEESNKKKSNTLKIIIIIILVILVLGGGGAAVVFLK